MSENKYMTVVFEYKDGATFPSELTAAFKSESSEYKDTRITAISLEDEISRVEQLEEMDMRLRGTTPEWGDDFAYSEDGKAARVIDRPAEEIEELSRRCRSVTDPKT